MNDLFSGSFSRFRGEEPPPSVEMTSSTAGVNLDKFFEDVESIKEELREMESLQQKLHDAHEQSKTLHNANSVKELRSRMDSHVSLALKKAKLIKLRLEALDRSNAANRSLPGCGPGSSSDRTRTSVVNGLRKKLRDSMDAFTSIRNQISSEYRETVQRRYFTVTGENPDEKTVDLLISTGESETFLQKAIQEQGRGRVLDTISEIRERHESVKELERNLKELHQVFLDMAVLVQAQGEQLDDIESQVARANSFVTGGTQQLQTARKHQISSRKWTCYGIIILIVIILLIVLFTVRPWENNGSSSSGSTSSTSPPPPPPPPPPQPYSPSPPFAPPFPVQEEFPNLLQYAQLLCSNTDDDLSNATSALYDQQTFASQGLSNPSAVSQQHRQVEEELLRVSSDMGSSYGTDFFGQGRDFDNSNP